MNEIRKNLNNLPLIIYWTVLFSATVLLLYLILPGEPKFKYEYRKGFPWQHKNLVAPFDFAILKSDEEIQAEKAEMMNEMVPYFHFDTIVAVRNLMKMNTDLISISGNSADASKTISGLRNKLNEIYQAGILQRSPDTFIELKDKSEIKKRVVQQ